MDVALTPLFIVGTVLLISAQLLLPKHAAFVPLLVATCHFPNLYFLDVGGFRFTLVRLIIAVGIIRGVSQGFAFAIKNNKLDKAFLLFGGISFVTGCFHNGGPTYGFGLIYNTLGSYFYMRAYLHGHDSAFRFAKYLTIILIPLAYFMIVQRFSDQNPYSIVGAPMAETFERYGRVRANGPFAHAILAGTAGASSLAIMSILWFRSKPLCLHGIGTAIAMTFSSNSSGPISTLIIAVCVIAVWRYRQQLRTIRILGVVLLFSLHLVMQQPVWYLMAKVDFTGGSTGYHRARLISAALDHIGEWWLVGTDRTIHWMPTGVSWSEDHTDLTNMYIKMGVEGGLPLMLSFIWILQLAFQGVGRAISDKREQSRSEEYEAYALGSTLFAHCLTFLSVSYFDQIFVLFYGLLALMRNTMYGIEIAPSEKDSKISGLQECKIAAKSTAKMSMISGREWLNKRFFLS